MANIDWNHCVQLFKFVNLDGNLLRSFFPFQLTSTENSNGWKRTFDKSTAKSSTAISNGKGFTIPVYDPFGSKWMNIFAPLLLLNSRIQDRIKYVYLWPVYLSHSVNGIYSFWLILILIIMMICKVSNHQKKPEKCAY